MLYERSRRIGFWLDGHHGQIVVELVARLVSDTVLVTDVHAQQIGGRRHVRIGLFKSEGFNLRAFNRATLQAITYRHPRQKRRTIAGLPAQLVWRLCKDRRWHVTPNRVEEPVSVLDD